MNWIEMASTLEIEEIEKKAPRNWIPERSWRNYNNCSKIPPQHVEISEVTVEGARSRQIQYKLPNDQTPRSHWARSRTKNRIKQTITAK